MKFDMYCKLRLQASFGPFSLHALYVIMMYTMKQTAGIAQAVNDTVLQADIKKYKTRNPEATDEEMMENLVRFSIPESHPGSPGWFRRHLRELFEATSTYGLPHLFVTLTADEVSTTRFHYVDNIDEILSEASDDCGEFLTWKDAPVEGVRAFHARLKEFWHRFVVPSDDSKSSKRAHRIFGRVQHYIVRYEFQARGSLHAH
eukprot:scaffold553517_cov52-Prasinocladus_malaysianus.AAC.1